MTYSFLGNHLGASVKDNAASSLQDHLGYWLRFVSNHVSHAFARKLESRGITVAEWVVLRELYNQPAAVPSEVADSLGMTRGAISKLVDRLVTKALVGKRVGKTDRRFQSVALTARGSALVPKFAALADENDREFFGRLTKAEQRSLKLVMKKLVRLNRLKTIPTE